MSRVSSLAINAADHLVSKGRLDAAASILRNYLSTNSARPDILQRLGRILLAQGRSSEAIPLFQKALQEFQASADDAVVTTTPFGAAHETQADEVSTANEVSGDLQQPVVPAAETPV